MTNDLKLYRRARRHVFFRLILYFLFLCLYAAGEDYVLNLNFFQMESAGIHNLFMALMLGEIFAYLLIFLVLSSGIKWTRWLYWPVYLGSMAVFLIPLQRLMDNAGYVPLYLAWLFFLFIKSFILLQMGLYFFRNEYCRIFYEHVVPASYEEDEEEEEEEEEAEPYIQSEESSSVPSLSLKDLEAEDVPSGVLTRPQMAWRLGLVVYGELIVFPILVQVFASHFASMNMQNVFATRLIFIECIFTAFVWTIPVFFLYFNQRQADKTVWACLAAEILFDIWVVLQLKAYWATGDYSSKVFIFFGIVNVIRYIILLAGAWPAFKKKN
jgi:hypothetical protein